MSANNPLFKQIDRAACEIPNLLKKLGEVDYRKPISQEQAHMVDAIATHAYNAQDMLIDGIGSLGRLMNVAGLNDQYTVHGEDLANLGALLAHLAVEVEFLRLTESDMRYIEREQKGLQAGAKQGAKS
jgi:hypothetical protein